MEGMTRDVVPTNMSKKNDYYNLSYMIYIKKLSNKKPVICIEVLGLGNIDEAQDVASNLDNILGKGMYIDNEEGTIH